MISNDFLVSGYCWVKVTNTILLILNCFISSSQTFPSLPFFSYCLSCGVRGHQAVCVCVPQRVHQQSEEEVLAVLCTQRQWRSHREDPQRGGQGGLPVSAGRGLPGPGGGNALDLSPTVIGWVVFSQHFSPDDKFHGFSCNVSGTFSLKELETSFPM